MLKIAGSFDWNRPRTYEAESGYNTLTGTAYFVPRNTNFSTGAYVTGVGSGAANTLQFNQVAAPSNGLYEVDIYYACASNGTAQLSVNGGAASMISFPATGSNTSPTGMATSVQLRAGANTLKFSNAAAQAPNFDKIVVSLGTPGDLHAVGGDGQVQLNWTAPADGDIFNVYRGTVSGKEAALPIATGLSQPAYMDTNVTNGQTYYYTVTALNPTLGGESPPSVEATAEPRFATSSHAYQNAVLADRPLAYWRLNETNGTTAYDQMGAHNGLYANAVVLGRPGPRPPDFLGFELTNTAAQFTGNQTNSWVLVLSGLNLSTNTMTITAWIYPTGSQADWAGIFFNRSITRNGTTVAGLNYGSVGSGNAQTLGYTWNNNANTWGWNSGLMPPRDQWSFVALVIQPASATLYLINPNGEQSATNFVSHPLQIFGGVSTIGTDTYAPTARVFNGLIDEVAVFNHPLTSSQIQQLYENGCKLPQVKIGVQRMGGGLNLIWPQGTLLQSPMMAGPWTPVADALSPDQLALTNGSMFYRILLEE